MPPINHWGGLQPRLRYFCAGNIRLRLSRDHRKAQKFASLILIARVFLQNPLFPIRATREDCVPARVKRFSREIRAPYYSKQSGGCSQIINGAIGCCAVFWYCNDKFMIHQQKEDRGRYYEAVGRRKTSVARVRIYEGSKLASPPDPSGRVIRSGGGKAGTHNDGAVINARSLSAYFPIRHLQQIVVQPIVKLGLSGITMEVKVSGGGIHSQAEAVRHGIARALIKKDIALKPLLKVHGFLTRDARAKERRKFGLKKARRAPQWSKR